MISDDFLNKFVAQKAGNEAALGFENQVDDYAVSTIADVGTSLFNSVVAIPKLFGANTDDLRVETYDLLRRVNEDYANYFLENKDLVEASSFIAGSLIPAGTAFKGMKLLQAGKLGMYPSLLSDATQAARISELERLLIAGQKMTPEFRSLRWKILSANAGQEMLAQAGAEVAVVASMNQHPWMEDYLKDPVKNFGISMLLGGVLGTGIGQLQVRKQLRDRLGAISTEALDKVTSKLIDIPLGISDVDKVQRFSLNAESLRAIASDESNNPLTRQIAEDFAIRWEGMAGKLEQTSVFGPALKASKDTEAKQTVRNVMLSDESFGANRVDFLTYDPKLFTKQKGVSGELLKSNIREAADPTDFAYRLAPASDEYEPIDRGLSILDREGKQVGILDYSLIGNGKLYINNISSAGSSNSLGHAAIRDLAVQLKLKFPEITEIAGERISGIRGLLNGPLNSEKNMTAIGIGDAVKNRIRRIELWNAGKAVRLAMTATEGLKKFRPDWAKLMQEDYSVYYSPYHKAWIPAGDIHNYARAVDTGLTTWEKVNVYKPNPDAFSEFAVREVPTATADKYWINTLGTVENAPIERSIYIAEGDLGVQNAWLSRLARLQADGKPLPTIHLVPEDMSNVSVSQMRKSAKQITLDELEAHLANKKYTHMYDLLKQGASAQEIGIRLNIPTNVVEKVLLSGKRFNDLPAYEIAPVGSQQTWRAYTDSAYIENDYLAQKSRTLTFSTNGHRVASLAFRNADMSANLDAAKIKQMNRELMATIIAGSESAIAREFYQVLNKDDKIWDVFEQQISNIVNEKSGSFFFSSADFAARDMGDIGRIATTKGQEFFGVANNVSQRILSSLSTKVRAATQTQVGLNEFNEIINLLQSTTGYRDIDAATGILYRLVEQEPGVFIKEPLKHTDGAEIKLSDNMKDFLLGMRDVSRELWHMKNTINRIQGFKELNDIGLWIPSFNPLNKFISYVIDTAATSPDGRVKLLIGKSPEELAKLEANWKAANGANTQFKLVTKAQQEDYNFWQMRQDPTEMDFADISKFHSGASASALPSFDDSFATTIIENLHNRIIFYGRKMQEMYLDDIMSTLDTMSAVNQKYFAGQPTLTRALGLGQREDAARAIKNVLLGNNNLGQYSTWQSVNNGFAAMVDWVGRKTQDLYHGLFQLEPEAGSRSTMKLSKSDYIKFNKELESVGVKNPFKDFNDYLLNVNTDQNVIGAGNAWKLGHAHMLETLRNQAFARKHNTTPATAERIIAAGNSVLATFALRVLETGQAFVNAISWPIMTLPEIQRALPKTYLGTPLGEGVAVGFPTRAIMDGIRFRHSDAAKPLIQRWINEGFGASIVSEATRLNTLITQGGKGALTEINKILDSDLIKLLSIPSDFAEKETRLWSLATGYQLARRMYPGISDAGADLFAKEFMMKSVGNYYSAQRPAMFQGTFGVAIGLFQTYMLSWAQSAFRSIETGSFKALSTQMLAQAGLFGMNSLPLYSLYSKTIGEHFSDKHYDLTTGTYRALPDHLAEFIVYGLPASLGVGLYTRGDMQPRIPFTQDNPADSIAAINAARQFIGAGAHTMQKVFEANGIGDKFRGFLEGLAMQSISRPLARIVEALPVPDGQGGFRAVGAVSREGNTIATSHEIWTIPGIASRLLASRSTEEQIKREVDYLNSFYGSIDYENRKSATEALKTAIRGGNLTSEKLEEVATEYLRTGTATGWKAALNEALATSEGGIDYKLGKRLRPDSPFQKMIQENY